MIKRLQLIQRYTYVAILTRQAMCTFRQGKNCNCICNRDVVCKIEQHVVPELGWSMGCIVLQKVIKNNCVVLYG